MVAVMVPGLCRGNQSLRVCCCLRYYLYCGASRGTSAAGDYGSEKCSGLASYLAALPPWPRWTQKLLFGLFVVELWRISQKGSGMSTEPKTPKKKDYSWVEERRPGNRRIVWYIVAFCLLS